MNKAIPAGTVIKRVEKILNNEFELIYLQKKKLLNII